MADFRFDLALDELAAKFGASVEELRARGAPALFQGGEIIMANSKAIVPVDEGILRGSGHVALPVIEGDTITVTLSYGGPAKDYARGQHENETYHHTPPGQAHYLSEPLEAAKAWLAAFLAHAMQVGR